MRYNEYNDGFVSVGVRENPVSFGRRRVLFLFFYSDDDFLLFRINDFFKLRTVCGKAAFTSFGRAYIDGVACDMTVITALW